MNEGAAKEKSSAESNKRKENFNILLFMSTTLLLVDCILGLHDEAEKVVIQRHGLRDSLKG